MGSAVEAHDDEFVPDMTEYDIIAVSSSGGKDSQAMLHHVYQLAKEQGVPERVVVIHADLGEMEWPGTKELAEEQAQHYGAPFHVVSRIGREARVDSNKYKKGEEFGDLIDYAMRQGKWPDNTNRWCTSDFKRGPIIRAYTMLTDRFRAALLERLEKELPAHQLSCDVGAPNGFEDWCFHRKKIVDAKRNPVRILECMGFRSEESPARAKRPVLAKDERKSNTKRTVDTWLPIKAWSVDNVWETIRESGVRHHQAYDLGMPRLSCVFCIFGNRQSFLLAGEHNLELLKKYVDTEIAIGHTFQNPNSGGVALVEVLAALEAGERVDLSAITFSNSL